jgi:hypothetical protein
MQTEDLTDLVSKAAALMEIFERRCERIDQRQQAVTLALQQLTEKIPATLRQSAEGSLRTVSGALLSEVQQGLGQPVDAYMRRLSEAGSLLHQSAKSLAEEMQRARRLHRALLWKLAAVTTSCLLILLLGAGWLSLHYYQTIQDEHIAADLLKAYNGADVTLCDGRLCANIDPKGKRYGDAGQYQPTRAR